MKNTKLRNNHIISGLFLEAIALCMILSFRYISVESTAMLAIFNLLFAFLIFQLNGTLRKKLCVLALGNIIGLFWNYIFFLFAVTAADFFGQIFGVFYVVLNPLLNLTWIVSFWSISLTFLANPQTKRVGQNLDY